MIEDENEERKGREVFKEIPDFAEELEQERHLWFLPMRRHSFSINQEERFLLNLPDDPELPREKCIKLIDEGKLIEENSENLRYLIKLEAEEIVEKEKL